jgi:protein arginine kinase activator
MSFSDPVPNAALPSSDTTCEKCGMSFEEFQKVGKLGCSHCYDVFSERLKPILKRLHGAVEHSGKITGKASESIKLSREIQKLKDLLNEAIKNEQYEKAAELRDKIRSLEVN